MVQVVGGTLEGDSADLVTNFVSSRPPSDFAALYKTDKLSGGHVIMLGPGNENAARSCLDAYPNALQLGGGVNPANAESYLRDGASHVIVTSYLFDNGTFVLGRLKAMADAVGKDRLVVDLSCKKQGEGQYCVATNRWQTLTDTTLSESTIALVETYCAELLVHAVDVEGKCEGIDESLVQLLGQWTRLPVTYAGGARQIADIRRVEMLSDGKVDLTIGSALDIFGGSSVKYADAIKLARYV